MSRVVHFEIHCDDLNRAEQFYKDVFEWDIQSWDGPMEYRMIETGSDNETGINGALVERRGHLESEIVNSWVNTIEVDDIVRTEAKIVHFGGQMISERQAIPGVGWQTYFRDTEGNAFGCMEPDPEAEDPKTKMWG